MVNLVNFWRFGVRSVVLVYIRFFGWLYSVRVDISVAWSLEILFFFSTFYFKTLRFT